MPPAPRGDKLKIGVVGSGRVGGTLGGVWVKAGHEVMFSSRDLDNDKKLAASLGPNARAGTPREAAAFGEVLLISVPYRALPDVGKDLGTLVNGKVVIDTCNPIPARDGDIATWAREKGAGLASAELLPGARIVRAFNAIGYTRMGAAHEEKGARIGMPIAGDDAKAVELASRLIREIGYEPVLMGGCMHGEAPDAGNTACGGAQGGQGSPGRCHAPIEVRSRHEVPPMPAGQPGPRPVLPRLRQPPGARLARPVAPSYPAPRASVCSAARPSPRSRPRSDRCAPETYTPRHLAEKILTSKAALEGERKRVTVLFADLKGSMELLAERDPEDARRLLDPVLERMIEAVHRYEGTVNQVMGDGIMALFGAPLAHEDHAVRACYAALRMQDAVSRYAEDLRSAWRRCADPRWSQLRGRRRSLDRERLRMDYTAVGQSTHLAARMEQLARPGTTLMTEATLHEAEGYVQVKPLGPTPIKGMIEPMLVYELIGAGAARTRLQASAERGLTRFIGRDAEVEQLRQALDRADAGGARSWR